MRFISSLGAVGLSVMRFISLFICVAGLALHIWKNGWDTREALDGLWYAVLLVVALCAIPLGIIGVVKFWRWLTEDWR